MNCKMLSMDTSVSNTGYAYWENGILTQYGSLKNELKLSADEKVKATATGLLTLLKEKDPDIVVAELTVVPTSAEVQRNLTLLLGVLLTWGIEQNKEVIFLRPSHWRKLVYSEELLTYKKEAKLGWKEIALLHLKESGIETKCDDMAEAIHIGVARIIEFNETYQLEQSEGKVQRDFTIRKGETYELSDTETVKAISKPKNRKKGTNRSGISK